MSSNVNTSVSLSYRAPGGSQVTPTVAVLAPYNAQVEGTIDISAGTASGVAFTLAFGSIASPTCVLISNTNIYEMAVWAQGLSSTPFHLAAGGVMLLSQPLSCTSVPMSACSVVTTVTQTSAGTVEFMVFGDP